MPTVTARDLVMDRLVEQARVFPDLSIQPLDVSGLAGRDDRDGRLAQAIDHAVARHWITLVTVIESRLTRPWGSLQPDVQAALLAGAGQLLYLDRLPDHAVIDAAVEWTKGALGPGAGGLVNAVLRKVAVLRCGVTASTTAPDRAWPDLERDALPLGDGRIRRLAEPVFAEDRLARLAQQTSHPPVLLQRWIGTIGKAETGMLALHGLVHAPIIIHNSVGAHAPLGPHDEPGFSVFEGDGEALRAFLAAHVQAMVQDPASAAAVRATGDLKPRLILDVCAGMGTKTKQLATIHPAARILATDVDAERRATLREVFAGHERVRVIEPAELRGGGAAGRGFDEQVDLLVLDVPCSNTGVLARRVEAKYRADPTTIERLAGLQRQIIADAIPLLAPDGSLLYATCSIEPAENQAQAAWMAKWHRLRVAAEATRLPRGLPGDPPRGYSDGGYLALLRRSR